MELVIAMPEDVVDIIEQLNQAGYEAYAVGGCVRDSILGRQPEDWDITTSAQPLQVKQIFVKTIDTGIQHGTVTVMRHHVGYEITTYRIDGEYLDGRHPSGVEFTADLLEDLKRRDFTINAMAYHHKTGLIDAFDGVKDLQDRLIRCVGNPADRFTEDALRMLRAVRFAAQLGFQIDPETLAAVKKIAPNLNYVSKERIQTELTKLLLSAHPELIMLVKETSLDRYITNGFDQIFEYPIVVSDDFPVTKPIRWAALLYGLTENRAAAVLADLKLDNFTINRVKLLIKWKDYQIAVDKTEVRKFMSRMQPDEFDDFIEFRLVLEKKPENKQQLQAVKALAAQIRSDGDCLYLKDLAINGGDLIKLGIKPGKELGEKLQQLLAIVLEHPQENQKDRLLEKIL